MTSSETEAPPVSSSSEQGAVAWFTPGRFAALLGVLIALTFLEVLTGQATFFYRDFGAFTYPVAHYQRECFWRGEFPLWNPLNNCGVPFLAQWNTATLYPPTLFYLIFPLSWSLGVFGLGHLFLAGMGMYFLARRWTGNSLAAAMAGTVFAFNGLSWHMLVWVSNLAAWAWMPWVVRSLEQAWREGGGRRIALAALAGGMQMLTGSPELIFLTWCVAGTLCVLEMTTRDAARGSMFRRLSIVGLLVAGLAAAQLLPFLDLLQHSNRDANYSDAGWAMPGWGPANFLVPLFRCFESGHGVFAQYGQYWTPSYYEGAAIVALALLALVRIRERRVGWLAALALAGVLLALGPVYTAMKSALPLLGFMRYPIKFVALTLFALPLLAAYGLKGFLETPTREPGRAARRDLLVAGLVVMAAIGVILCVAWKYPKDWENWPMLWRNGAARAGLLVLTLGLAWRLPRTLEPRKQWLLGMCLPLALWADIYTHAPRLNPTVQRAVYEPGLMRAHLKLPAGTGSGEPRFMPTLAAIEQTRLTYLKKPADDYLCRRLALYQNCNLLDDIPKVDGFFSSSLKESDQLLKLLYAYDARGEELKGLKDFLGVASISAPLTTNSSGLDWTNRTTFLPLVIGGQQPVFADGTNAAAGLLRAEFDPREVVYLPTDARTMVTATNRVEAKIRPIQYSAQRLEFEVEAAGPALVTVGQSFHHAWQAAVDGRNTPVLRANHAFQALEVPAGKHRVTLVYRDGNFLAGGLISLATLASCGVLAGSGRRKPAV